MHRGPPPLLRMLGRIPARVRGGRPAGSGPPELLFVCGGNTSRSAMAAAIASTELADVAPRRPRVASAGVSAAPAGRPLAEPAAAALRTLGVPVPQHRSRQLTREMCADAAAVYCMTESQRTAVLALAPALGERVVRLDPAADLPEPTGSADGYVSCARRIRELVRSRVRPDLVRRRRLAGPDGG